ncbi:hypothetical protein COY52_05270 [Candidatus Desantisbacteria bacterium CG_4_10_14_0_8_um_filter_48_22]|uniref:EamA domain-containing protein n=1 Tax=Candidatus Desantisbacteria bacterium CG_4_10_14_0_8_um_filter_48_22 TaxID=1974543 RepID=A0A2M7SCW9_9BACT|nr:MAG: hypothetical protein COS16_11340 [Candidatus Desantisbacteria bacterium CG02_land_8_20_14_3_00_49_13]PIZ17113.1 MAG: hypothetical protein COY52_05270 [Candidatus Desantisbacteria bacterium CG_4_10_14_0_8_um_filter_48_22]PJB28539.1 MAG: hypothetical protein CO111_01355 [Candidatus Desantisbacteria bacterium CG_4_9_14_3_um_filter_50_7]
MTQKGSTDIMNKKMLLVLMAVGNALPSVFIKYLSSHFDPFTQSFYRFLAAGVFFLIIAFIFFRTELKETCADRRSIFFIILLTLVNLGSVVLWVTGIYLVPATLAELLSKLQVIIIVVFSYLLFRDEQEVIRSRSFFAASILCIAGVAGVILGKGAPVTGYSKGVVLVILGSFLSSIYALLAKKALNRTHPVVLSTLNVLLMSAGFLLLGLFWGDPGSITRAAPGITVFMLFSGVIGVGSGVGLYLLNIRSAGVVVTNMVLLVTPLFTAIFAFLSMGEKLTPWQMVWGAVLVTGCYILIKSQRVIVKDSFQKSKCP